jgi:hypothetical protein
VSVLTPAQIYGYARGAGFSPASAVIATAVALAESDGNTEAHNDVPPDDSYGLWQVNMLGSLGAPRRAAFGLSSNSQLFNPATNARAAYKISSGGKSFQPWSTYTNGAYKGELGKAAAVHGAPALTGPLPGGDTSGSSGGGGGGLNLNPLDAFGLTSGGLTGGITHDLARIAIIGTLVAGGAALVVVGLLRAVQPTVQKVANVAGTAAKAAAA